MSHTLLLARRYLAHHRGRTAILAACIALVALLPLAVNLLVMQYDGELSARARATPLVAGAKGSRYDLVLNALYFKGRVPEPTSMAEVETIREGGLAQAIPILARRRAKGYPIVGTSYDYFDYRGLRAARGTAPLLLGDCAVGARAAAALGVGPGDTVLTDPGNVYDLSLSYPLRMNVAGVLAPTDSPDDDAIFVSTHTAWVIEGIGHGHVEPEDAPEGQLLARTEDAVAFNASVAEYQSITPENAGSFHFHGEPAEFPLTAVLVLPHDTKSSTLLKGRYRVSRTAQVLVPREVVDEILGFVFQVKRFFDANVALVSAATGLFLALIIALTLRVRRNELETLRKIGCARSTVFRLVATELFLTLGLGVVAAMGLSVFLVRILRS